MKRKRKLNRERLCLGWRKKQEDKETGVREREDWRTHWKICRGKEARWNKKRDKDKQRIQ